MSDILTSLALGAGAGVAGAGISYFGNKSLAKQQQKYYRENAQLEYMLGQKAQINAPGNIKRGMMMAGMNPALASEGHFSPASQGNAPLGAAPHFDASVIGQNISAVAQSALAQAEANKANAEAEKITLENDSTKVRNASSADIAKSFYNDMAKVTDDPEKVNMYHSLAEISTNQGALYALADFTDLLNKKETYDLNVQENLVKKAVARYQLEFDAQSKDGQHTSPIADLAELPSKQFAFLHEQVLDVVSQIEYRKRQAELLGKDLKLADIDIRLGEQEIKRLREVTEHLKNTNLKQFADKGDWKGFLIAGATLLLGSVSLGASYSRSSRTK